MFDVTKATSCGDRAVLENRGDALPIEDAYSICRYSKATRANVPVKLTAI
jgi:organic hydroperoxide reductase OsmC/OhrA